MDKRDELLLLIAVSGELPADWVGAAVGSESYGAVLLTRLKRDGEIKLRNRDGLRGYILREKAKRYLKDKYGLAAEPFLYGSSSTNHVKSEPEKRLRLYRMSQVWIFCRRAGIGVFAGEKPELFGSGYHGANGDAATQGSGVSYYGTAEWKLPTDQEIKGSRACGLLTGTCAYVVYNTMDSLMKWAEKTERNLKSRLEIRLRRNWNLPLAGAVFMGTGEGMAGRLLSSEGGVKENLFALDDVYERYYYVPLKKEAALQLLLLASEEGRRKLRNFLCSALEESYEDGTRLEDGRDKTGRPVYFCYLMELWKVRRIAAQPFGRSARIFCFTYQAAEFRTLFPDWIAIEAIDPERVRNFLGWD